MGDDIKKKILDLIKNTGVTKFEIESRQEALGMLFSSFYTIGMHHFRTKQIKYLLEPDTMSEEEWIDYIEFAFGDIGLFDKECIN